MDPATAIKPGVGGEIADLLDVLGRTTDAMVAIDGDFGIIAWNDAATKLLGYEPAEALGKSCSEILGWRDRCGDGMCDGFCPAVEPSAPEQVIETQQVLGRILDAIEAPTQAASVSPTANKDDSEGS